VTPVPLTLTVDPSSEKLVPVRVTATLLPRRAAAGATEGSGGGPTELPARDTGEPPIGALALSAREPSIVPPAGAGELNTTVIVPLAPAASVVGRVPPEAGSTPAGVVAANVALIPVSAGAPTGLLSVMVCAALTVPCA